MYQLAKEEQIRRWELIEAGKSRKRRVADSEDMGLHPLWRLPTVRHSTCAANWLFGRFPAQKAAVRTYLGGDVYETLNKDLKETFLKSQWEEDDLKKVTRALEGMSEFWAYPLRNRRLHQV